MRHLILRVCRRMTVARERREIRSVRGGTCPTRIMRMAILAAGNVSRACNGATASARGPHQYQRRRFFVVALRAA
jgi:hypothetical protein